MWFRLALTTESSAGRKTGDMDYFASSKLFGDENVDVEAGDSGESTPGESSTASRVRVGESQRLHLSGWFKCDAEQ